MKILIPTVSRSDFGILLPLIDIMKKDKKFDIKTLVTGEHYSKKMGNTFKEIISKKIEINSKIRLNEYKSNPISVLKKSSEIILKFSSLLKRMKPNLLIVLGDKYETLILTYCAFIYRIPIAHVHGGEKTVGSLDDTFRHQISKMSDIHFVERKIYKKRLIQLGENPKSIVVAGSLAKETLMNKVFLKKKIIEKKFKIKFFNKNVIFTYHPEINNKIDKKKINNIFSIIEKNPDIKFIITSPNLDIGSDYIRALINKKIKLKNVDYVKSFGQDYYFSILKIVDGIIGNSSSGLIEVPTLKRFSINIGIRQKGRFCEKSVINCSDRLIDIQKSLNVAYSTKFKKFLKNLKIKKKINTSDIILKTLKKFNYKKDRYKVFNDINLNK
jgi:GDP/UDP-N,N'-diacetylbacillosamine 2-epimerase (hydrolysing)